MGLSRLSPFSYTSNVPRVGEGVRQTQIKFQPQGWYNQGAAALPNQYIRFDFRSDGFWDPKTAFINIDIESTGMPFNSVYQIDNSAQSIINQYIARKDGIELIRKQEYDELAALLYDLHLGPEERHTRVGEGIGRNSVTPRQMSSTSSMGNISTIGTEMNNGLEWPQQWQTVFDATWRYTAGATLGRSFANAAFRPWWCTQAPYGDAEAAAIAATVELVGGDLCSYFELFNMDDVQGVETPYIDSQATQRGYTNLGPYYREIEDIGVGRTNTEAGVGTMEYWMSNYVLKPTIKSGMGCYERTTHASFQVPLLCPIFGATSVHEKLLPMRLFEGLEMEFLINPYAFFAVGGGYNVLKGNTFNLKGDATYDSASWNPQTVQWRQDAISRFQWSITKFEICVEMTHLPLGETQQVMSGLESSGFALDFKTWYLGPRTKFGGGASLNTTIQINNGFTSLNVLAFYFSPADYEQYSYCRKHKRISNNLTSMQLRMGTEYIPSQPITGHAGNIRPDFQSGTSRGNYVDFWVHTMKAFGKWLGVGQSGLLNPTNYTLNTIGYVPDASIGVTHNVTSGKSVAFDAALFWENQCVPRNVFAFDLERFDMVQNVRSGWDTTNFRPFDLLIANDNGPMTCDLYTTTLPQGSGGTTSHIFSDTQFPRPYYMYIWMYYDARISWTRGSGWLVDGRI